MCEINKKGQGREGGREGGRGGERERVLLIKKLSVFTLCVCVCV